jgi:broad specificity phosphatase PhoE
LKQIHDPGLTPGGIEDAKNFRKRYRNLRNPTLVVTSPLRRCLQTTVHAFSDQIKAGRLRAIANPDLQEVSTDPCDTGTPLDVLREEFPLVEFPDEIFPDIWPRDRNIMPKKDGTIYDDISSVLASRELRIREWLRTLDDSEIVVVTHGSFAHFLFNAWEGEPGNSESHGFQLETGKTVPLALPDRSLPMTNFQICGSVIHIGPVSDHRGMVIPESTSTASETAGFLLLTIYANF